MTEKLNNYKQKRNFEKTKEPTAKATLTHGKNKKLHYVVQHHLASRDHYDFRLEWNGVLLSWAVPKGPSKNPSDKRLAVQVEDHPFDYKDFEGTIPQGEYGGGTVMLWDEGFWQPNSDVESGLKTGSLKFELFGSRLKGEWALVRLASKDDNKANWLLIKDKDEFAKDNDGLDEFSTSIRTGRTMEGIASGEQSTKNPFDSATLQLAKTVDDIPHGDDWLYEIKYDGYRIAAYVEDNKVRLLTRNGKDFTRHFKDIASSLKQLANGRAMVFDGEAVIVDDKGKTDFQKLQNHLKKHEKEQLTYAIFDILALDGKDLRAKKLIQRKTILENVMQNAPDNLYYSKHTQANGLSLFEAACEMDLEGIIGKNGNSIYSGTRNNDWVKLKCDKRQEFVVGGYSLSKKQRNGLSSVLVGYYAEGNLVYAGRAGTGFSEKSRRELAKQFSDLVTGNCPFLSFDDKKSDEEIFWLKPQIVAEVKFAEWTNDGLLRQASFKGLRVDKVAKDVANEYAELIEDELLTQESSTEKIVKTTSKEKVEKSSKVTAERKPNKSEKLKAQATKNATKETSAKNNSSVALKKGEIEIGGIRVTSPDKVIFQNPKITKAEIVEYYSKVAKRMLKYAGGRILSTVRCPKGVAEPCFFKKHPKVDNRNIVVTPVKTRSGTDEYFYIDEPKGIIYEAQMGTLEFHTWGSRVENLEKPDMMVFDLDPDEGMDIKKVRQGVKDLKSILKQLSLKSFLKVSGGKGYHVVVPFLPTVEWDAFYAFAKQVAGIMENKWPDLYTSNMSKKKRAGKIYIDWVRNGRGATSIAPYSVRARKGGKVAMPISWKELDAVAPDAITMQDALARLSKSDPWKNFYKTNQSLKSLATKSNAELNL